MNSTFRRLVRTALAIAAVASISVAQGTIGPDVIVGDLHNVQAYGSSNGISAFAVGTISCNIGDTDLLWQANTNFHPVIRQSMYRLKNGRFEELGMSWLKHGFLALAESLCTPCTGPSGQVLSVGCSDPYDAGLNGSQSGLGPSSQVDAAGGVFVFPPANPTFTGNIARRLQVKNTDLDPTQNAGALYFVEGHYVTEDDASSGNKNNNASHRRVNVSGSGSNYSLQLQGATVRQLPAIYAWKAQDFSVQIKTIDVPNDGRIIVAYRASPNPNGSWHYEFAVHNLSSDRSVKSFSVPLPTGAVPTNIGFHDVDYHSGDGLTPGTNFDGTDWTSSTTATDVTWSTVDFAVNPNANALRWGTLYNFRFDAAVAPTATFPVTLGLFKPGTVATVQETFDPVDGMTIADGNQQVANIGEAFAKTLDVQLLSPSGVPIPGQNVTFTVLSGSVTLATSSATTDAFGIAQASLTAGNLAGTFAVRAETATTAVIFNGYVRSHRLIYNPTAGALISNLSAEASQLPVLVAFDFPMAAPGYITTDVGRIYTTVLNPTPTLYVLDGIGIFNPVPDATVRTSSIGVYQKIFLGLGGLAGTGTQIVSQAYALMPNYVLVSNPAYQTF